MRWLSRRPDTERLWRSAGPVLRSVAEAGFIAVVYAALSVTLQHRAPVLGPIEFTILVALGYAVAVIGERNPKVDAPLLVVALIGAGIAGWLASLEARDLLGVSITDGLRVHVIGWLGAVAVLRGSRIQSTQDATLQLGRLLGTLLPAVAVIWAIGWQGSGPDLRPSFVVYAMWGSLALIVSGMAGLGLTRLRVVHANVDARVRSLWRWIVVALAISVVPLALPFVVLAGTPVELLLQPLVAPLRVLLEVLIGGVAFIVEFLVPILRPFALSLSEVLTRLGENLRSLTSNREAPGEPGPLEAIVGVILVTVVTLIVGYAIVLFVRWLITRPRRAERSRDRIGRIERTIVIPPADPPRPTSAARRRHGPAHDAVGAYVSAIDALADHPSWARAASETPADHASRIRATDMPDSADLSRLAADYQLARYAERPITAREDRRALFRLDRLRRALR